MKEHTVAVADTGVTAICWRLRPSRFRRKMMTPTPTTMMAIAATVPKTEILKREIGIEFIITGFDSIGIKLEKVIVTMNVDDDKLTI